MHKKFLETIFKHPIKHWKKMTGGTTPARNYQFEVQGKKWVLRLFNPQHTLIERKQEGLISYEAGEYSIAGKVIYYDDMCMVREYVDGEVLTDDDLHNKQILATIVALLKKQHQIPTEGILPAPRCEQRIAFHLRNIGMPNLLRDLNINFDFTKKPFTPVLIHNDLHHANILFHRDEVKFIDWSLAGTGNPFADLAEIGIYLNEEWRRYLLTCYFGNDSDLKELNKFCRARLLLFTAWALNMANTSIEIEQLQQAEQDFSSWAKSLTRGDKILHTSQDFIDFAASCINEFLVTQ